MLYPISYHKLC